MTTRRRRWSFRTRLTALIACVFVVGGAVLLGVQYFLVQGLFSTAIEDITGCIDNTSGVTVTVGNDPPAGSGCTAIPDSAGTPGGSQVAVGSEGESVLIEQTTMLSQEVLSGLLLWSIATLLVFTILAVVAASWLSRRSFARIGQITDTTKRITRHDLHQRLELPGPADEIKELGDTIDTMLDGLEASFTQQERFITNASHELRTPLTTTRTALEIPLAQGQIPEHLKPAIRRALDANQRSEQLITVLLRLAKTTKPGLVANENEGVTTEFAPIIEHSVTERHDEIERLNLTVTTGITSVSTPVADETLLTLAIDNLVDNAIRHNLDHGTLHISTGYTDEKPWIRIANSGAVFTEEEVHRLIEPFNRGLNTRTLAGSRSLGLGLTLVHNIVESIGGTLTLDPAPAGGIIAQITLTGV